MHGAGARVALLLQYWRYSTPREVCSSMKLDAADEATTNAAQSPGLREI